MTKVFPTLKELRKSRRITRRELASRIGSSTRDIWDWERGEEVPPSAMVIRLSEIFCVSVTEVYKAIIMTPFRKAIL